MLSGHSSIIGLVSITTVVRAQEDTDKVRPAGGIVSLSELLNSVYACESMSQL